jgi:hypothetical protein
MGKEIRCVSNLKVPFKAEPNLAITRAGGIGFRCFENSQLGFNVSNSFAMTEPATSSAERPCFIPPSSKLPSMAALKRNSCARDFCAPRIKQKHSIYSRATPRESLRGRDDQIANALPARDERSARDPRGQDCRSGCLVSKSIGSMLGA